MSTIYILWLRQLKRYIRSKPRILGSLGQPILLLLALGFGFGPIYSRAGGGDYIQFLAPGIIGMGILFNATFSGIEIIWDRQFGFLKETLVSPVSRLHIIIGRTLGGGTVALFQGFIIFAITLFVGLNIVSLSQLPLALVFMVLIALFFTGLGTAIASVLNDMHAFPLVMNFVIMPLFFLSGALFPFDGLPKVFTFIAKINPLSYGVDGLRGALTGISHFGLFTDFVVLSFLTVLILAIGSYLFSKIQI